MFEGETNISRRKMVQLMLRVCSIKLNLDRLNRVPNKKERNIVCCVDKLVELVPAWN